MSHLPQILRLATLLALLAGFSRAEEENPWYVSGPQRGKIEVRGRDAKSMQTLYVWGIRGVSAMEKEWETKVPFPPGMPLRMVVSPEVDGVRLDQRLDDGRLWQMLRIPEEPARQNAEELAEAFARAILSRMVLSSLPEDEKRLDFTLPPWLVAGTRRHLLTGESEGVFRHLMERGWLSEVSPPDVLAVRTPRPRDLTYVAESALMFRWLSEMKKNEFPWAAFAKDRTRDSEWWVRTAGVDDLRDLHLQWDVWRLEVSPRLIAEYRLRASAFHRLEDLLHFPPATLGVKTSQIRYTPLTLPSLASELDAEGLPDLLSAWILRLQSVRFRQDSEFNQLVNAYRESALALLEASRKTGGRRRRALERFSRGYAEAEALREAFRARFQPVQ